MKIVVLDGYTLNPGDLSWDALAELGDLTVHERTAPEELASRMAGAELVFTNKTPLSREAIFASESLKYIGVLATGYNVVDAAAARERGIAVANVPTYGTAAVAQHAFALLLEICNRAGAHDAAVKAGRWQACADFCFWDYPLIELSGKTFGCIGYGRIGRAAAAIARGFGMRVLAYDAYAPDADCVPLCELLRESDVVSLHCPLAPGGGKLVDADFIAGMKDGAILINTSRGALVDEAALRAALVSGKLYAAATDVSESEPPRADSPLLGLDNLIITPHIAWAARESRARLMAIAVSGARAFIEGRPENVVN